jgi:sugar phosphate permease
MITYMDRVVISSSVPSLLKEFGFSMVEMGLILSSFRLGYSLFNLPGGWLGDLFGPRRTLTWIVVWWSVFTSATALSWNLASMLTFRFLFGMGEAGAFPNATRSLSRWILPSERGYAQGVTHAGSRLGAAMTPPIVVWIIHAYGWRTAFVSFGTLGIAWAAVWFWYYRDSPEQHKSVNAAELDLIHSSMGGPRSGIAKSVPWKKILASRTLWYLSAMYFCYGYCLAVYLDWFPTYLNSFRHFSLKQMGFYASLPLLAGAAGDFMGGICTDWWLKRTGNVNMARRVVAMSGFLLAAAGIIPATLTANSIYCVYFTCIAVFGLEFTVGVAWAVPLDIGGDFAGSTSAVMNTCGNMGGTISSTVLAYLVDGFGWNVPFLVAAGVCVAAAVLFCKIDASRQIFAEGT